VIAGDAPGGGTVAIAVVDPAGFWAKFRAVSCAGGYSVGASVAGGSGAGAGIKVFHKNA